MNIFHSIREAVDSLNGNKMRSALTILGIVIGVAAVIALLGIGSGTQDVITQEINNIGTNLIYVTSGGDADYPEPITLDDGDAIANPDLAPSVNQVAPVLQGRIDVSITGESTNTEVVGITPAFYDVQSAEVSEGIRINQDHLDSRSTVIILGSEVAETLFGQASGVVGESVRINGQPFRVRPRIIPVRHRIRVTKRLELNEPGFRLRLHLLQQGTKRESGPGYAHRPGLDAPVPIRPLL